MQENCTVGQEIQNNQDSFIIFDRQKNTCAMNKALRGEIPQKQYHDEQFLRNMFGDTVAMILAYNKIDISQEWLHDSNLVNNNGETVALIYAKQGKIPPSDWIHDPNICDKNGFTVSYYLNNNRIPVPNEWYDDKYYKRFQRNPYFIEEAIQGKIPQPEREYQAYYQNCRGWTTAMILAKNKIYPPTYWQHDPTIQNKYGYTVALYLSQNGIIPGDEWLHDPKLQDIFGNTVAMNLANNGIIPPSQWMHNPTLKNNNFYTVAMLLAKQGVKDIPKEWEHNKMLRNYYGETVQMIYLKHNIYVPEFWRYQSINNDCDDSLAMMDVKEGKPIYKEHMHEPTQTNRYGQTVALLLLLREKEVPKEWLYDNKTQLNENGDTTAMLLAKKGICPTKPWLHEINLQNKKGKTIEKYLQQYGFVYVNDHFEQNVNIDVKNEVCQICLIGGEREFIKTTCGHNICYECYKELQKFNQQSFCPCCKQRRWVKLKVDLGK